MVCPWASLLALKAALSWIDCVRMFQGDPSSTRACVYARVLVCVYVYTGISSLSQRILTNTIPHAPPRPKLPLLNLLLFLLLLLIPILLLCLSNPHAQAYLQGALSSLAAEDASSTSAATTNAAASAFAPGATGGSTRATAVFTSVENAFS